MDGHKVYAGNLKLMNKIGVQVINEHNDGTVVYVAIDDKYAGCIVISDVIKPTTKQAIEGLKNQNIKTVMLTGDSKAAADRVAAEIGIDIVKSELLPADKVAEVENLLKTRTRRKKLLLQVMVLMMHRCCREPI